jgi:hypothetical protein
MLPAIQAVPVATCGAKKKRTPGPCSKPAGWRTEHPGQGKCYLHGGATPIKHGRYSSITRPRVRELIEKHEADADPLNILPELAAARALFEDFVERYDHWRDALLAWHKSYTTRNALPEQQAEAFRRCSTNTRSGSVKLVRTPARTSSKTPSSHVSSSAHS